MAPDGKAVVTSRTAVSGSAVGWLQPKAISLTRQWSFRVLLDPLQDFLAMYHFVVGPLNAVDLEMLPMKISRASEGPLFACKLWGFQISAVKVPIEDRPVRHCRSPLAPTPPAGCGLGESASSPRAFSLSPPPWRSSSLSLFSWFAWLRPFSPPVRQYARRWRAGWR
jgi:hypothetical protein